MNKILLSFFLLTLTLSAQENIICDSSCCKASKDIIEKNNYLKIEGLNCPEGYTFNKLKCIDSLNWCEPTESNCLKLGQGETLGGIPDPEGWKTNCCANLKNAESKSDCAQSPGQKLYGGYSYICINCGDKLCDQKYESKCNCPEDCS